MTEYIQTAPNALDGVARSQFRNPCSAHSFSERSTFA